MIPGTWQFYLFTMRAMSAMRDYEKGERYREFKMGRNDLLSRDP